MVIDLIRAAASEQSAADILKRMLVNRTGAMLAEVGVTDRPQLRANLAESQFLGLAMQRYIVKTEPLASMPKEAVINFISPLLQHYITEDLG